MNRLIKKVSFGFIKTDEQAEIVKFLIIIVGVIWFFLLLSTDSKDGVQPPSAELINAPQPINR